MATKYAGKTRDELGPLLNAAIEREQTQGTAQYDKDIADVQAQIAAQGGKPGSDPAGERKWALAKQLDRAAASVGLSGKDLAHFKNDILVNQKNGNVEQKSWMARHGYLGPMLAMIGGGVGGGLAAGALAGAAVPAASGSGAAAGGGTAAAGTGGAIAGGVEAAPVVGGMIPGAAATPLAGTGSVMSKLGGLLTNKDTMSMIGQGLGAASGALAHNRGNELGAQQSQDVININRSQENRAERGDAWKQLQHADYVLNNKGYENKMGLPSFGIARTGEATPDMRQGAEALRAEVMKRLQEGSTLPPPADVQGLAKPGIMERLGGYLAPVMTAYGGRGGR